MLLKPFGSLDANNVQFLAWPSIFVLVHWENWKDLEICFAFFFFFHKNIEFYINAYKHAVNKGRSAPVDIEEVASDEQKM